MTGPNRISDIAIHSTASHLLADLGSCIIVAFILSQVSLYNGLETTKGHKDYKQSLYAKYLTFLNMLACFVYETILEIQVEGYKIPDPFLVSKFWLVCIFSVFNKCKATN